MTTFRLDRLAPPAVSALRAVAAAAPPGASPVLVGGAVRDVYLARRTVDVDVAVPFGGLALARRVADRLGATFVALDEARGTARVLWAGLRLDVSEFRAAALESDLTARDFTVDAMAVDIGRLLSKGRAPLIDPTGGLADLKARRLRLPGPGVLRDDPLRALRAVRLEGTLGFRLTPVAARHVREVAPAVAGVAPERVRDELIAILGLAASARFVRRADDLGLLRIVLPEVEPMRRARQPLPHRFMVLEHSLRALAGADQVVARPAGLAPYGEELATHLVQPLGGGLVRAHTLKLAALLHDVAKPETARVIDGRLRFFEHDVIGAARVRAIGERLRLPLRATDVVERLVRHHLRPMHLAQPGALTRRARYRFFRELGPDVRDLLLLALVDAAAVTGASPRQTWRRARLLRDLLGGWAEEQIRLAAPPLVRGEDVMERYGLGPGPAVGQLLERAREAQAAGLVATREEALAYLDSLGDDP
jgi:putative nucleotidyltransferase with HDIG domain